MTIPERDEDLHIYTPERERPEWMEHLIWATWMIVTVLGYWIVVGMLLAAVAGDSGSGASGIITVIEYYQ